MMCSSTPALPAVLACAHHSGVAFDYIGSLGSSNDFDFVAQYTPYVLTVYASTSRCRFGRKTRYEASG
jgi:hypothetical protein